MVTTLESSSTTLLLEKLDLLIHREIVRMRAVETLSRDEFQGLYVSDQQVDALLARRSNGSLQSSIEDLGRRLERVAVAASEARALDPVWQKIRELFDLDSCELDVILVALAAEYDTKYETLFAYLNNDVSRRFPTVDLALRLFTSNRRERNTLRARLQPASTLFRSGLLLPLSSSRERPAHLASGFSLSAPAMRALLELPGPIGQLNSFIERTRPFSSWDGVPLSANVRTQLQRFGELVRSSPRGARFPLVVLQGAYGCCATEAVEAFCAQANLSLLQIDLKTPRPNMEAAESMARSLLLEQQLEGTAILVTGIENFPDCNSPCSENRLLFEHLIEAPGPVFLHTGMHVPIKESTRGKRTLTLVFEQPSYEQRVGLWTRYSKEAGLPLDSGVSSNLAARFVLTAGQIREALQNAMDFRFLNGIRHSDLSSEELFACAREQSDQNLGSLAAPVRGCRGWDDLVLPPVTLRQAREVACAIRNRQRVYDDWGFAERLAAGKGLKVLFSGPAGTGKTLTAGIIASDLGLSLYKISLSGIVSKYIGDTEKNLDRVFEAAQSANAILFFDEADALFGKRSDVKDAHDRYANIEIAYLLQKTEEYNGPVILATNLSKNMDGAFARRMQYVVEFPMPNSAQRAALWRKLFPPEAPLAADIDFDFLAEQFPIAGGDIRNVVLAAAFLAARDESAIQMAHIIQALSRQLIKSGKAPGISEFKQYHAALAAAD